MRHPLPEGHVRQVHGFQLGRYVEGEFNEVRTMVEYYIEPRENDSPLTCRLLVWDYNIKEDGDVSCEGTSISTVQPISTFPPTEEDPDLYGPGEMGEGDWPFLPEGDRGALQHPRNAHKRLGDHQIFVGAKRRLLERVNDLNT